MNMCTTFSLSSIRVASGLFKFFVVSLLFMRRYKFLYDQTKDYHLDYFDSSNPGRMADMKHGGLLAMSEIFRASNRDWEMRFRDIEETILTEAGGGLDLGAAGGGRLVAGSVTPVEGATTTPPEKLRGLGAMRQYYRANFGRGHKSDSSQSMSTKQKDSSYIPFR